MKMHKILLLSGLLVFTSSPSLAETVKQISNEEIQNLENAVLSCSQVSNKLDSDNTYKCLINGHNLILKNINTSLNNLKQRDKVATLNTKGLDYEVLRYNCEKVFLSKTLTKECQVYIDISYLNYLQERFN